MLSLQGLLGLLNDNGRKTPEFLYKWREVYYGMSLHIDGACPAFKYLRGGDETTVFPPKWFGYEYQRLFEVFHFNKYPWEPEITRQWRLSQYKPFTQAPFLQAIQVVTGAIFQDSGYSITIEDKEDNEYIWGDNFDGKCLPLWFADKFQNICEDPNGYIVAIPAEPGYATTTKKVEPKLYFIPSKDIIHVSKDEILFNVLDYSWAVNSIGYFRFEKQTDGSYRHVDDAQGGYYAHMLGHQPILKAGGLWNTQGFYDSWLNAAKPIADDYIGGKSDGQQVNKQASHPFMIFASEDCPTCNGTGSNQVTCPKCHGDILDDPCAYCAGSGNVLSNCQTCFGKGAVSHNPGDVMVAPAEDMDKKLIQIVNPDVEINKFHAENNKDCYNSILRALHLHYIDEAQSGVAKDKDMETRYQFVLKISNDMFDRLIEGIIKTILGIRNVKSTNGIVKPYASGYNIVKPTQFQIKTASDLLGEYDAATKALLPDFMRAAQLEDFVDKQFGGNDVLKRKTCIINEMDIMCLKTESDKQIAVMNNAATNRDWQFSINLPKILDQIIREKGSEWFLNAEYAAIETEVQTIFNKVKPIIPEIEPIEIDKSEV